MAKPHQKILKALAKDPDHRFQTAREFSRALQTYVLKRGVFIASDEVAAYMRAIFSAHDVSGWSYWLPTSRLRPSSCFA